MARTQQQSREDKEKEETVISIQGNLLNEQYDASTCLIQISKLLLRVLIGLQKFWYQDKPYVAIIVSLFLVVAS